jgi:hypothetical protein
MRELAKLGDVGGVQEIARSVVFVFIKSSALPFSVCLD